jgi:DUF971 family protein
MALRPERMEVVGAFFAVLWNDGSESIIGLEALRRACPCARCAGEPDVTGAVRMPAARPAYVPSSFQLAGFERVGHYAVALTWGDGHNTGIYSWDLLRSLED